ncbi:MAG TPA: GNAT family N-acetyltransferase [Candidatus Binatia bacterium]|nr:GNAT family N-acetyltransferase [Candidatus Binatia bacterium]
MRTIRTARLRLVPVTPANAGLLWHVLQQPDLRSFQDLPDVSREQFERVVGSRPKRFAPGVAGRFEWLLHFGAGGGEPLGWVSLRVGEMARATAEIGYSVVRSQRGKGIATEAVGALIEEGFRRAHLAQIRAYCLPENLSSRAVLRNNGFEDGGTLARGATVQGRPVDVIVHTLDRERWSLTSNLEATRS